MEEKENTLPDLDIKTIIPEKKQNIIKQTAENNTSLATKISTQNLKNELPKLGDSGLPKLGNDELPKLGNYGLPKLGNLDSSKEWLFWNSFNLEFKNKTSDEIFDIIQDKTIWLDINSPKEWDKWIEENKDTLPPDFKKVFSEKFSEIYADVDASLIDFPNSIDKNIKNKAKEIYNQEKWPYLIDFNELSKDIPFDIPITSIWREELIATLKAKANSWDWILKFDNKKEALKTLAEFQEAMKEASETVVDLMFAYMQSIKETLNELWIAWDEGIWTFVWEFIKEILPTLISISILNSLLRVWNRSLIRAFAWAPIVKKVPIIKYIDKLLLWKYNPYEPWTSTQGMEWDDLKMIDEINARKRYTEQTEYLFQWHKKELEKITGKEKIKKKILFWKPLKIPFTWKEWVLTKYGRINENMIAQTFYRKLGNIIEWKWLIWNIIDISLKPILVANYKEWVVEENLKNRIKEKNKTLKELFTNTSEDNTKWFIKINLENAEIKENGLLWEIKKSLILSHDIPDWVQEDVIEIFNKYIEKIKKWYIPIDDLSDSKKIIENIKKEIFKEINSVEWIKINDDFLNNTKELKDSKIHFLEDYNLEPRYVEESLKELIWEDKYNSIENKTKSQLKSFIKEVKKWDKNYSAKTFTDIISRILNWEDYEKAITDSFKIKTELIESIQVRWSLEDTLNNLDSTYPLDVTNTDNLKKWVETTNPKKWFIKKNWERIKDFKLFKWKTSDEAEEIIENADELTKKSWLDYLTLKWLREEYKRKNKVKKRAIKIKKIREERIKNSNTNNENINNRTTNSENTNNRTTNIDDSKITFRENLEIEYEKIINKLKKLAIEDKVEYLKEKFWWISKIPDFFKKWQFKAIWEYISKKLNTKTELLKQYKKIKLILNDAAIELTLQYDWEELEEKLAQLDKEYTNITTKEWLKWSYDIITSLREHYKEKFSLNELRWSRKLNTLLKELNYSELPEWINKFSDLKKAIKNNAYPDVKQTVIKAIKKLKISR